jgi:hypothetical protein
MASPKETTVTQKSEPWAEAKPFFLNNLYPAALDAFSKTNKKVFGGDLWAGPTPLQKTAATQMGANKFQTGATGLRGEANKELSGYYLTPDRNPYIKATVDTALGDVSRKYTRDILPGLGDAAIKAGAYGGDRYGITQGLAAGEYSREANTAATNIYAQNYESERQRQQQAGTLYNQANALEQQHLQGMAGAGQQQQQWQQGQLGEDYQRWQMKQAAPWAGIPELLSVLTGGNFQSTSSTGPNPNYTSPLQMIMGLGSMISGLGSTFGGGGMGGFPPAPMSGMLA